VTTQARRPVRAQQRRRWPKYLPETMGSPASCGSMQTETAGRTCCSSTRKLSPDVSGPRSVSALYRKYARRRVPGHNPWLGAGRGTCTGSGATAADFDNDGKVDVYITALGKPAVQESWRGRFLDVHQHGWSGGRRVLDERALFDYDTDGKVDLSSRTTSTGRWKKICSARWTEKQILLHAGIL